MSDFLQQFTEHINHVDVDFRLMALYSLRESLCNGISFDHSVVVDKVLACLTLSETKDQVHNEAVTTLPFLAAACTSKDQSKILWFLLRSVAGTTDSSSPAALTSDLSDLCGLALKSTATKIAANAQRDVSYWQRELDTISNFSQECANVLGNTSQFSGKDTLYMTLSSLIPVFGSALEENCVDDLLRLGLEDTFTSVSLRRVAAPYCASLAPFARDATVDAMQRRLIAGLAIQSPVLSAALQLCEALVLSDEKRMGRHADEIILNVNEIVKNAAKIYEDSLEIVEAALRILERAFVAFGGCLPSMTTNEVLSACEQLAVFDPNYCGNAEADYQYTDDYYGDEYYDEGGDSTWKLRTGALRVANAVTKSDAGVNVGKRALTLATLAIKDRAQDVQIEAFSLVAAVSYQSFCSASLFRPDFVCQLLDWTDDGEDKLSLAALRTVGILFRAVPDFSSLFGEATAERLSSLVRTITPGTTRYAIEVVTVCKTVLEMLLKIPGNPGNGNTPVKSLALAMLDVCGNANSLHAKRVFLSTVMCYPLLTEAFLSCSAEESLLSKAIETFNAVAANASTDCECRAAALEAMGACVLVHTSPAVCSSAITTFVQCLEVEALTIVALKALQRIAASNYTQLPLPEHVFAKLSKLFRSTDFTVQELAFETAATLVRNWEDPSLLVCGEWMNCAEEYLNLCQTTNSDGTGDKNLRVFGSFMHLLVEVFTARCNASSIKVSVSEDIRRRIVVPAWSFLGLLAQQSSAYATILKELTQLSIVTTQADKVSVRGEVLRFLSTCAASPQQSYVAVGAAVEGEADDKNSVETSRALLDKLASLNLKPSLLLLCTGEVGRILQLPLDYEQSLLSSVQDESAEVIRLNGELSLSLALSQPENRHTYAECVARALGTGSVKGRYYYLRALRAAVTASASSPSNSFCDASHCKALVDTIVASTVDEEYVELAASCVGAVAYKHAQLCIDSLSAALSSAKKEPRHLCAASVRFVLVALQNRGNDANLLKKTVMEDLCNDLPQKSARSVAIKTTVLRVLSMQPRWLQDYPQVLQYVLDELREIEGLVGSLNLGGYSHRTDKGLEMRKVAFACLACAMESDRVDGLSLFEANGKSRDLVDALIHASSPVANGEKETSINNKAKVLLAQFVQQYPKYSFTEDQMTLMCSKFKGDFDSLDAGGTEVERKKALLTYTVYAVTQLAKSSTIAHYPQFRLILHHAQRCDLLPAASKILPAG